MSEVKQSLDGGTIPSNRSSMMMEGGSATGGSHSNKQMLKNANPSTKQVKFQQDADVTSPTLGQASKPLDFTASPAIPVATGSTSTIDYMRKAVINLNTRVQDIEKKISKVEGILNGQQKVIKTCVQVEKENWMS